MKEKKRFNPWPTGLVMVMVFFCSVQFYVVSLASTTFEGLDDVEYYRHGIEYGKEIERQEKQKDLGWTVAPRLVEVEEKKQLQIALADADGKPVVGADVEVKMGRPATVRDDTMLEMKMIGPGIYASDIEAASGHWKFDLTAQKRKNVIKASFRKRVP